MDRAINTFISQRNRGMTQKNFARQRTVVIYRVSTAMISKIFWSICRGVVSGVQSTVSGSVETIMVASQRNGSGLMVLVTMRIILG